jgi:pimeloyl-ACP methyl ester carboxylesterase
MAYWRWGRPGAPHVVLCVHGLTRQGRDFDTLAQAVCDRGGDAVSVICPDVAGRGRSDWLKDPECYQITYYAGDMLALLSQLQPGTLDWVGTSMGGLIGMAVAGQPELPVYARIRRLVLNDVGPTIEPSALVRIGQYLGNTGAFNSEQQAADATSRLMPWRAPAPLPSPDGLRDAGFRRKHAGPCRRRGRHPQSHWRI